MLSQNDVQDKYMGTKAIPPDHTRQAMEKAYHDMMCKQLETAKGEYDRVQWKKPPNHTVLIEEKDLVVLCDECPNKIKCEMKKHRPSGLRTVLVPDKDNNFITKVRCVDLDF